MIYKIGRGMKKYWRARRQVHRVRTLQSIYPQIAAFTAAPDERKPAVADKEQLINFAWETIEPSTIIKHFSAGDWKYFWQNEFLTTAFATWAVVPRREALIRNALALCVADGLIAAEDRSRVQFPNNLPVADALARVGAGAVDPEFFSKILYPIGGMRKILTVPRRAELVEHIADATQHLEEVVRVIAIFHHRVDAMSSLSHFKKPSLDHFFRDPKLIDYYPASFKHLVSVDLKRVNRNRRVGERTIQTIWKEVGPSIPIIYAADSIMLPDEKTLLDGILTQTVSASDLELHFVNWMGKSRYIAESILTRTTFWRSTHSMRVDYGDVKAIAFDPPNFSEKDKGGVKKIFDTQE